MKISQTTLVSLLLFLSIIGLAFGSAVMAPNSSPAIEKNIVPSTIPSLDPVEHLEMEEIVYSSDNLPLGVPEMGQGEIESIVCNDEENEDSYTIKYKGLSDEALEAYAGILENAGFETTDIEKTDEGQQITAEDGLVGIVVIYKDGEATINADLF